jgi:hypothetical protein
MGVKKVWLGGLKVQFNFSVAWMSNTSFLMGCMSKTLRLCVHLVSLPVSVCPHPQHLVLIATANHDTSLMIS